MTTTEPAIPDDVLELSRRLESDVLAPIKRAFVDKDEIVDLLGVSLVAGEHLFLLGPPGTAKSALVHELSRRIGGGRSFSYLLTRFTEPSELFGPFDIRKLKEGELVTNTEGMLPEASLAFLDELLNANSAILNSLLTVLNERVFRRGRETRRLPLLMVVGASNHLPEDDALGALFDRFLLRVACESVPDQRLGEVLHAGWRLESAEEHGETTLDVDDVRRLNRALTAVDLEPVHDAFVQLVLRLRQAGLPLSDRRAVKLQRVVAASALVCGRATAARGDLWPLRYTWDTEEQREILRSLVADAIGDAANAPTAHPRAHDAGPPDPDELAADLDEIDKGLRSATADSIELARLRDRLSILAGRCEWVAGERERTFLQSRIEELWRLCGQPD